MTAPARFREAHDGDVSNEKETRGAAARANPSDCSVSKRIPSATTSASSWPLVSESHSPCKARRSEVT